MQHGMQVTRLEVRVHCKDVLTAACRETAMVVLACIVVACSTRLEALDLHFHCFWVEYHTQQLLVRRFGWRLNISPSVIASQVAC